MTAQINDLFRYNGIDFSLAGISEGELFDPAVLELKPVGTCTACWRGYQAVANSSNSHSIVRTLGNGS